MLVVILLTTQLLRDIAAFKYNMNQWALNVDFTSTFPCKLGFQVYERISVVPTSQFTLFFHCECSIIKSICMLNRLVWSNFGYSSRHERSDFRDPAWKKVSGQLPSSEDPRPSWCLSEITAPVFCYEHVTARICNLQSTSKKLLLIELV